MKTICPACGSIIGDLDDVCSTCGWFDWQESIPLDESDFDLLHIDLSTITMKG